MSYSTIKIKLQETGEFDGQNLMLGVPFNVIDSGLSKEIVGVINSVFVLITSPTIKYDFDILFFNSKLQSVTENGKSLKLLESDALNCFGKLRIESNGNMADDYLNPVGGYYFAHLFNINLPFSGKNIVGLAVYQDGNVNKLNNNTHITINYNFGNYVN